MAKQIVDWDPIERACIAGMSFVDAEKQFGVKANTIVVRAKRCNWPTPSAIVHRASELARKASTSTLETLAQNWVDKGEAHRMVAFDLASESLKRMKPLKPRGWKDAEIVDKMARRAAGLDNSEVTQATLVQVNERINADDGPVELLRQI